MIESVLVAVDDSPLGVKALEYALDAFPDAEITAVHVAYPEYDMLPADTEEVVAADLDDLDGVGDEVAREVFDRIRATAHERPVAVTFLLGEPQERIVEYAEEGEFDEVVLGTHGRDGVSRVLIGSVAEAVAREVPVPTTLVK